MPSPRFIFGGWDPFPNDATWILWQKILGILVDCLNNGNDADPGATPTFFPEGFTPRRDDQKIQRIQFKVLGILVDKFDGHFGPPVAPFSPATKPEFFRGFYYPTRQDSETVVLQRILAVLVDRAGLAPDGYNSRAHQGVRILLLKILRAICAICSLTSADNMLFEDGDDMLFEDGEEMLFES